MEKKSAMRIAALAAVAVGVLSVILLCTLPIFKESFYSAHTYLSVLLLMNQHTIPCLIVMLLGFLAIVGSMVCGVLGAVLKKPFLYVVAAIAGLAALVFILLGSVMAVSLVFNRLFDPRVISRLLHTKSFVWCSPLIVLCQLAQTALYALSAVLGYKKTA